VKLEVKKRDLILKSLLEATVKRAADIGQENLEEKERERIRRELAAEKARIQQVLDAYEMENARMKL